MSVIILIGFMGSGKTTLGRKLAASLGCPFVDLDTQIEQQYGQKIPEIFAQHGEDRFRHMERELIHRLSGMKNAVVATGGGMPCFGDNMALLNELGRTFYLERSEKELAHRLMNAKKERPLVAGKNPEELHSFIRETLAEREAFYRKAHYTLSRDQQNVLYIQLLLRQEENNFTV